MTEIYCKSDCRFANNPSRMCNLKLIQLSQNEGAVFTCGSYVKDDAPIKNTMTDIDRAVAAGSWDAMRERINR